MSAPDGQSPSAARSDEERAAFFEELMREELMREKQRSLPLSGFAVATLVFGLLGGVLAAVFGIAALVQIRQGERRGIPFVVAGLVALVCWVVAITIVVMRPAAEPVSGLELKPGECFAAPGMSGESNVMRLSCTEWHTGEVFADFSVPDGPYPGIVELYDASLARCEDLASQNGDVAGLADGRVQVMTPTPDTWGKQKSHRIVCYFRFSHEVDKPI